MNVGVHILECYVYHVGNQHFDEFGIGCVQIRGVILCTKYNLPHFGLSLKSSASSYHNLQLHPGLALFRWLDDRQGGETGSLDSADYDGIFFDFDCTMFSPYLCLFTVL